MLKKIGLAFDELKRKCSKIKHLRYAESEQVAISWYLSQRRRRPLESLFALGNKLDPNHLLHTLVKYRVSPKNAPIKQTKMANMAGLSTFQSGPKGSKRVQKGPKWST